MFAQVEGLYKVPFLCFLLCFDPHESKFVLVVAIFIQSQRILFKLKVGFMLGLHKRNT